MNKEARLHVPISDVEDWIFIWMLTKMAAMEAKNVEFSQVKNKIRRSALYQKEKLRKGKEKRERKRKRKQEESQEKDEVSGNALI